MFTLEKKITQTAISTALNSTKPGKYFSTRYTYETHCENIKTYLDFQAQ